ncbi:MAG: CBS domain-containing protein [Rubrivivax sp.]|jgi:CBS domain-containing protein|nr:CBS domain-containing protein [Rubrivivax sp.]
MIPVIKEGIQPPRGTAADILATKPAVVHAIAPGDTVYDAVAKMNDCRVGALLVMDGPRLVGILSERDYARKIILLGRLSKETKVEEIMVAKVICVEPSATLAECMRVVTEYVIRHLPVVKDGQVLGMLSTGDLVRALLEQQAETIQKLNSFIGSDYPS